MTRRRACAITCGALIATAATIPAAAYPRPGITKHVSVAPDGSEGNANCFDHDVDASGRYVAFTCSASNLVPGDSNQSSDIFVRDLETGVTEFVSVSTAGARADANSFHPAITDDARFVAFASDASNLVVGDTNDSRDVFVRDLEAGITTRVSLAANGGEGDEGSELPSISADGTVVAFQSEASNLVSGDTNGGGFAPFDIFVRDLAKATTERVSVASDGTEQNGRAHRASLSRDGRYVAFQSLATNLSTADTNATWDVFVHDRVTRTTERVSESSDGTEGDGSSLWASISGDGRYVAFDSLATNLVPSDDNQEFGGSGNDDGRDVFVHDRQTGVTERVSVDSSGAERPDITTAQGTSMPSEDRSSRPSISADGRFVAYENNHIEPAGPNFFLRIYDAHVHDRLTGTTGVVTVTTDGENPRGTASYMPSISAAGRYVTFAAHANNIAPSARDNAIDVFLRDRGPTVGPFTLSADPSTGAALEVSGTATFAGTVVTSGSDPSGDSGPGAEETGADLVGADVVFRPEQEDLLLKWSLAGLPGSTAGLPGVVYGLRLDVGGVTHEVRALRAAATTAPPAAPYFALYRCDPVCVETARLAGGLGTTGDEVRTAVPLDALSASAGTETTSLRAYTALGEAAAGEVVTLDELALPEATLSASTVRLAIAPPGTPESEVTFDTDATLADGHFSGTLDVSSLPSGDYEVWARACLGDTCGSASTPVTVGQAIEKKDTILELTVEGRGQDMILKAGLSELDAPQGPIAGRTIDFYSDSELIGSDVTDADGIAGVLLPPGHRGANRIYQALFAGDDSYLPSSDERPARSTGEDESDGTTDPRVRSYRGAVFLR